MVAGNRIGEEVTEDIDVGHRMLSASGRVIGPPRTRMWGIRDVRVW